MQIVNSSASCTACRTCQLMCSFHHVGRFQPEEASITIQRNNRTGNLVWTLDSSCDLCAGESGLLCIAYCQYGALRLE